MASKRQKPDTYLSIRCLIPAELEEELPELLASWAVLGAETREGSDAGIRLTVFLAGADTGDAGGLRRALVDHGAHDIEQGLLEADDWLVSYREATQPFPVGRRWWIDPHPDRPTAAPKGRRRLVIEPRMAFGTGSHESTRAILMALEDLDVVGRRVLDIGTGSGVLAFAAECLGAKWVVGLDIDEAAIWVAIETARQQEWPSRVDFVLGSVGCLRGSEFDIVLCNMIASSLLPLTGAVRESLAADGAVVFSGLLVSEVGPVSASLASAGLKVASSRALGEWASLTATPAR